MLINPKSGNCIWYHSTPKERVDLILKEGLKINSEPTYQFSKEHWIYIATIPFNTNPGFITFEVDCSDIDEEKAGWPFSSDWQLRVFEDIPPDKLKLREDLSEN